ncbi:MAG: hypothetical protein MZU95_01355 [Desulfomicrobium escambiense]|nr:hypothetical protein [Desulfomicrobium escambiense]
MISTPGTSVDRPSARCYPWGAFHDILQRWALVLMGGGAREAGHVGIIQVLEGRLVPDVVAGVHGGARRRALCGRPVRDTG